MWTFKPAPEYTGGCHLTIDAALAAVSESTGQLRAALGLPPHHPNRLDETTDAPRLYAYSPALLPHPADWPRPWSVTGVPCTKWPGFGRCRHHRWDVLSFPRDSKKARKNLTQKRERMRFATATKNYRKEETRKAFYWHLFQYVFSISPRETSKMHF